MNNALYTRIFNLHNRWVNHRVQRLSPTTDLPPRKSELLIITIAFNVPRLIEHQIERIRTHCQDQDYCHVIVDNSNQSEARQAISRICAAAGVDYVPVPRTLDRWISGWFFSYGVSHGAALNYFFAHYLMPRRYDAPVVALIDHDAFPLQSFSFLAALNDSPCYGVFRSRGTLNQYWYLWPGFSVFRTSLFFEHGFDFMPYFEGKAFLDTGGGNYPQLYRSLHRKNKYSAQVKMVRIKQTDNKDQGHSDFIETYDGKWVHLVNASNYAKVKGKEETVNDLLDDLDQLKVYL